MKAKWVLGLAMLMVVAGFLDSAEATPLSNFTYHYYDHAGNVADLTLGGSAIDANSYMITTGELHVTAGQDVGVYALQPSGPNTTLSPHGAFLTDNVLYPGNGQVLDYWGLLFGGNGLEINIWGNGPDNYSFWSHNGSGYNVAVDGGHLEATHPVESTDSHPSSVPEPGSLGLLGMGLFGIWKCKRDK